MWANKGVSVVYNPLSFLHTKAQQHCLNQLIFSQCQISVTQTSVK
jgi:hypothetical protein